MRWLGSRSASMHSAFSKLIRIFKLGFGGDGGTRGKSFVHAFIPCLSTSPSLFVCIYYYWYLLFPLLLVHVLGSFVSSCARNSLCCRCTNQPVNSLNETLDKRTKSGENSGIAVSAGTAVSLLLYFIFAMEKIAF